MTLACLAALALLLALTAPAARAQDDNPDDWTVTNPAGGVDPGDYAPWDPTGMRMSGTVSGTAAPSGGYLSLPANWDAYTPDPFGNYPDQSYLYQTVGGSPAASPPAWDLWLMAGACNWAWDPWGGDYFYLSDRSPIGGGVTASANGTLSNVWTYDPAPWEYWPADPPPAPDHLDLLVTTSLSATAGERWYGALSLLSASVTATDTLGDVASAQGSLPVAPPGADVSHSVTGRHLVRVPVVGGVAQASVGGQIVASVSDANAAYVGGTSSAQTGATIYADAQIDNREVGLTTSLDTLP